MIKIYPIISPLEVSDFDGDSDIFDASLPASIKKDMKRVCELSKVELRDLRYSRTIFFDKDLHKWIDIVQIESPK